MDPYETSIASSIPGYFWSVTYTQAQLTSRLNSKGYSFSTIVKVAATQVSPTGNMVKITVTDSNGQQRSFQGDILRSVFGATSLRFSINGPAPSGGGGTSSQGGVYVDDSNTVGNLGSSYVIGGDGQTAQLPSGSVYAITGDGSAQPVTGGDPSAPSGGGVNNSNDGSPVNGSFTFNGTGSGHNVGMSQWGAYAMAKVYNMSYQDIINFYFTGVTIG